MHGPSFLVTDPISQQDPTVSTPQFLYTYDALFFGAPSSAVWPEKLSINPALLMKSMMDKGKNPNPTPMFPWIESFGC